MPPIEDLPRTDSLGPADVRWLQSEFRATRELQVALNGATNTRLEEHHERISAVEKHIATRDQMRATRKKRWTITGVIAALLTVGSAIASLVSNLPRDGVHIP